jgi:hypothetical protein
MMARNPQPKRPGNSAVDLAIAAVEDSPRPSPLDMDMSGIDPDPTSLDLALPGKPDKRHAAETGAGSWQSKKAVRKPKKMPPASPR